jgi:hypothetical protein
MMIWGYLLIKWKYNGLLRNKIDYKLMNNLNAYITNKRSLIKICKLFSYDSLIRYKI